MHDVRPTPMKLMDAILSQLPLKLVLLIVLPIAFLVPYGLLQRFVVFPVRTVPVTALDRWIPFNPGWVLVYESLWLWLPIAPFLSTGRDQLMRYTRGVLLLSGGCFVIFFFWPVAAPRPASWPDHTAYDLLVRYDGLVNSIPSLHAGLVVYTGLYGGKMLRPLTTKRWHRFLGADRLGVGRPDFLFYVSHQTALGHRPSTGCDRRVVGAPLGLADALSRPKASRRSSDPHQT